jgi:hypothetical protein
MFPTFRSPPPPVPELSEPILITSIVGGIFVFILILAFIASRCLNNEQIESFLAIFVSITTVFSSLLKRGDTPQKDSSVDKQNEKETGKKKDNTALEAALTAITLTKMNGTNAVAPMPRKPQPMPLEKLVSASITQETNAPVKKGTVAPMPRKPQIPLEKLVSASITQEPNAPVKKGTVAPMPRIPQQMPLEKLVSASLASSVAVSGPRPRSDLRARKG